jgi:hypothetical protein
MDATTRQEDGALIKTNCPKLNSVLSLLDNSIYFHKNNGKNHFFLISINQMMTYYLTKKCEELYKFCLNCTKLSIDKYSKNVYLHIKNNEFMYKNWISIPFPSNYHYNENNIENNNQNKNKNLMPFEKTYLEYMENNQNYYKKRPFLISFVGSIMVTAAKQKKLRILIINYCVNNKHICYFIDLKNHESISNIQNIIVNNSNDFFNNYTNAKDNEKNFFSQQNEKNKKDETLLVEKNPYFFSKFCLTPGGDFPTRKSFLDSMLSGFFICL